MWRSNPSCQRRCLSPDIQTPNNKHKQINKQVHGIVMMQQKPQRKANNPVFSPWKETFLGRSIFNEGYRRVSGSTEAAGFSLKRIHFHFPASSFNKSDKSRVGKWQNPFHHGCTGASGVDLRVLYRSAVLVKDEFYECMRNNVLF